MSKKVSHCHKMIAEVAQGMAHELYDELMKDNDWYRIWKTSHPGASAKGLETAFVNRVWGTLIPQARATLGSMLAGPLNEDLKAQIHEALCLDASLIRGREQSATQLN